jgi:hypothetical protein
MTAMTWLLAVLPDALAGRVTAAMPGKPAAP